MLESQSKTIYDRSSLVAIQLPLAREPSVIVRGEGMLSFCNGCGDSSIQCNGMGKQGKDA